MVVSVKITKDSCGQQGKFTVTVIVSLFPALSFLQELYHSLLVWLLLLSFSCKFILSEVEEHPLTFGSLFSKFYAETRRFIHWTNASENLQIQEYIFLAVSFYLILALIVKKHRHEKINADRLILLFPTISLHSPDGRSLVHIDHREHAEWLLS